LANDSDVAGGDEAAVLVALGTSLAADGVTVGAGLLLGATVEEVERQDTTGDVDVVNEATALADGDGSADKSDEALGLALGAGVAASKDGVAAARGLLLALLLDVARLALRAEDVAEEVAGLEVAGLEVGAAEDGGGHSEGSEGEDDEGLDGNHFESWSCLFGVEVRRGD